jgi:hypothetical protein
MPIQKPSRYYGVLTNEIKHWSCNTMQHDAMHEMERVTPHMMRRKRGGEKKGRR